MKKVLFVMLLFAGVAAGWFWWKKNQSREAVREWVLYGNVDIRQVALAFDGSGRITEVRAEEGDPVKAGQLMAKLDTRLLDIQAREAAAMVEVQKQALLRLRNGSRPEEITQVRSQLASAEVEVNRAELDLSRLQLLQKAKAVSTQDVDHGRASVDAANARVEELRAALSLAELGPRVEEVTGAEAQLTASEARLAQLRHQIDLGTLRAPTGAVVRARLLEPGDMATPQKPVFALALTHPKWIRVYVNEPDLGKIKPGMKVGVWTDSHPDQSVTGTVGYLSSVAEFTPKPVQTEELRTSLVYEARILVEDKADRLRLGQPATVRIPLEDAP